MSTNPKQSAVEAAKADAKQIAVEKVIFADYPNNEIYEAALCDLFDAGVRHADDDARSRISGATREAVELCQEVVDTHLLTTPYTDALRTLIDAVQSDWIAVEDRLPTEEGEYLGWSEQMGFAATYLKSGDAEDYVMSWATHWKRITPPDERKDRTKDLLDEIATGRKGETIK